MKKSGKTIVYLVIIVLSVTIGILVGSIIKKTDSKIDKKEERQTQQLTQTTSSNAYVDMATHLSEVNNNTIANNSITDIFSCVKYKEELTAASYYTLEYDITNFNYVDVTFTLLRSGVTTIVVSNETTSTELYKKSLSSGSGITTETVALSNQDVSEYTTLTIKHTNPLNHANSQMKGKITRKN